MHQNLTFPVHPDPISGMHCWHQAVRVRPAAPGDRHGDIAVDTGKARAVYREWLDADPAGRAGLAGRDAAAAWLMRPLRPAPDAVRPAGAGADSGGTRPAAGSEGSSEPGRWELLRALGAVADDPADARHGRAAALGLAEPGAAEHTEVFVLNCPPYAVGVPRRGRGAGRGGHRPGQRGSGGLSA